MECRLDSGLTSPFARAGAPRVDSVCVQGQNRIGSFSMARTAESAKSNLDRARESIPARYRDLCQAVGSGVFLDYTPLLNAVLGTSDRRVVAAVKAAKALEIRWNEKANRFGAFIPADVPDIIKPAAREVAGLVGKVLRGEIAPTPKAVDEEVEI